jgi:phage-related tail fiber protein
MANAIRIKRRASGNAGAPSSLQNAELAFNEVDDVLYYGKGTGGAGGTATTVEAIGGKGAFVAATGNQSVSGVKTFNSSPLVPTAATSSNDTTAASTAFVKSLGYLSGNQTITFSGDATGSGATSVSLTLANSGVTAGTYRSVTVDVKGRVTAGTNPTTLAGYGITDSIVNAVSATAPLQSSTVGGTATVSFANQTANQVLAAPDGTSGSPTFRALAATDIPSLSASKISNFDTQVRTSRLDQMAVPTASVSLNSQKITNLATPTASTDAATKGFVEGLGYITGNQTITFSGDASGSGTTSVTLTLANSGIAAGTYQSVTVDAKGRVTAGTNPTTLAGYGITDTIVNAVAATAPLQSSTSTGTATISFASQTANQVLAAPNGSSGSPTFRTLAAADIPTLTATKVSDFDTQVRTSRLDQFAAPTASVSLNSQKITNLATPTADTDAATKAYVDSSRAGLDPKDSVKVATTANITLSGTQTIDGVAVSVGDRVLVKNQSTASENGIYVVAASTWTRATDFDSNTEVTSGAFTFVESGTVNADSGWVLATDGSITVGTTALSFTQFSGAGSITAGIGLTKTGSTLDVNLAASGGLEVSSNAIQLKSSVAGNGLTISSGVLAVGGTADRITVSADAVDIAASYVGQNTITTLGTVTTGTWNATTIAVSRGGTGATTLTGILKGNGTSAFTAAVDGTDYLSPNATIDGGTF